MLGNGQVKCVSTCGGSHRQKYYFHKEIEDFLPNPDHNSKCFQSIHSVNNSLAIGIQQGKKVATKSGIVNEHSAT